MFFDLSVTPDSRLVLVPPPCLLCNGGRQAYGLEHARQRVYPRAPNLLASQLSVLTGNVYVLGFLCRHVPR